MLWRSISLFVLALLSTFPAVTLAQEVQLWQSGNWLIGTVDGQPVNIWLSEDWTVGQVGEAPVNLFRTGNSTSGQAGNDPVSLWQTGNWTTGQIGDDPVGLWQTPDWTTGQIGTESIDLWHVGNWTTGHVGDDTLSLWQSGHWITGHLGSTGTTTDAATGTGEAPALDALMRAYLPPRRASSSDTVDIRSGLFSDQGTRNRVLRRLGKPPLSEPATARPSPPPRPGRLSHSLFRDRRSERFVQQRLDRVAPKPRNERSYPAGLFADAATRRAVESRLDSSEPD